MAATREHVIHPPRNRNPPIPVSNRFDRFDPLNMFEENGENEVDFGVQKVYQGFKYWHDPTHVRDPPPQLEIVPPPQPSLVHRHPRPPRKILPPPPLVHNLSPPTSPPLVENGFRNFLAMMMNWASAGWVVLFLAIGCCAFLLLQR